MTMSAKEHGGARRRVNGLCLAWWTIPAWAAIALTLTAQPEPAHAQTVGPDQPSIQQREAAFPGSFGVIRGHLVEPLGYDETGAVLVIHDRGGLNAHAKEMARRLGKAGYIALAIDMLSTSGGTPDTLAETEESVDALPNDVALDTARAGANWIETLPGSSGEVAVVGFGWGGALAARLAATDAPVSAAVAYYADRLPPETAAEILDTPLLLHYAGLDAGGNEAIASFLDELEAEDKDYRAFMYENVEAGFDDAFSEGAPYHEGASQEAFDRTMDFLRNYLGQ